MAITPSDFSKIWASNADTLEYTFNEADYLKGWDFVGNLPPTRAQWNAIQKSTDEKMKYVFDNFGAPLTASTVAGMTMQNRVYVYTGNETGYTAGHWYYWNGSAWMDGGVYNAVAVVTDTTLTQAGVPADAKATGDALSLKADASTVPAVDPTLTISGAAADAEVVGEKFVDLEALTGLHGKNLFDSRQFLQASGWTHGTDSEYYGVGTDLKNALGVNSSGLLVFGGFKANTQYAIRLQTYATGDYTGNMVQIVIRYTDTTSSTIYVNKADNWTDKTLITTADKTVSKIYIGGSYSAVANTIHFRNVQITEGAIQYPYEPYTPTAVDLTARAEITHLTNAKQLFEKVMDVKCVKGNINYNGNVSTEYNKVVALLPKSVTRIELSANAKARILCFRNGEYLGKIAVDDSLAKTTTPDYKDFYNEINAVEIFEKYNATNIAVEFTDLSSSSYITNDSTAVEWFKDNVTVYSIGDEDYDFIPDYYNEQVDTAISNTKTDMGNCGREGFSFIFTTDNHWNHNAGHSPAIIKKIQEKTEIQDVVLGGDMIDGSTDKAHELELLHSVVKKFISPKYRLRYCFGNHDGNTVGQTSYQDRWLSQEEVYMATQMAQKYTSNYADYTARFDYYWDDDNAKTRIIVMDSHIEGINLRTYQTEWFNATLASTPDGYRIIVIMHIWYGASSIAVQGQTIFDLVDAFNANSTNAKVVAMFGGHVHRDEYHETPGGVPLVLTTTDMCTGAYREVVNDQAVDVITVDYKNKVIHCRRVGKGTDREFELQ